MSEKCVYVCVSVYFQLANNEFDEQWKAGSSRGFRATCDINHKHPIYFTSAPSKDGLMEGETFSSSYKV